MTARIESDKYVLKMDGRNFTLYKKSQKRVEVVEGIIPPPPKTIEIPVGHFSSFDGMVKKCIALGISEDECQSLQEINATIERVVTELEELLK